MELSTTGAASDAGSGRRDSEEERADPAFAKAKPVDVRRMMLVPRRDNRDFGVGDDVDID